MLGYSQPKVLRLFVTSNRKLMLLNLRGALSESTQEHKRRPYEKAPGPILYTSNENWYAATISGGFWFVRGWTDDDYWFPSLGGIWNRVTPCMDHSPGGWYCVHYCSDRGVHPVRARE